MTYLVVADNHFCTTSSVITKRGEKYSTRLENQIKSLEWVDSFHLPVIHLGDFFDKEVLTAEEITCLKEIREKVDFSHWTFLQGNHGFSGGFDVMGVFPNQVITKPEDVVLDNNTRCLFLPFRSKPGDIDGNYDIIFGHIGIEGIPFGAKGFDPSLIMKHCKAFLNGHLHNRYSLDQKKGSTYWNIGSLTAQNFSDECQGAEKGAWILNTDPFEITFIENPHAFNFYKMSEKEAETYQINSVFMKNACISATCSEEKEKNLREKFKDAYYLRLNVQGKKAEKTEKEFKPTVDYLEKFRKSYIEKNGESAIILEELGEVTR